MSKQPRWIDKSEGRFSNLKSPRRSIIKGAESPVRFNSPLYLQDQGLDEAHQRKVSFAPDANFRVFNQTDSPSASSRFETNMITEEIHFTDSIQNLLDEDEPTILHADIFDSPSVPGSKRRSESPTERRKRRPDLFGSPSAYPRSPNVRSGGTPPTLLNRVDAGDLTDYLPDLTIKKRRNIFEEDDDDEDDEEELRHDNIDDRINDRIQMQDRINSQDDDMIITQEATKTNTQEDDMIVTEEGTLIDRHDSVTLENNSMDIQNDDTQGYSDGESMMITQEFTRNYTSEVSPLGSPEISPLRTLEISPLRTPQRSLFGTPHRSPFGTPQRSPFGTPHRSPFGTPHRSPFGTPLGTPQRSIFGTPNVISQRSPFGTPLGVPQRTPVGTPQRTPIRALQRTPVETRQRTPLGTPQRTPVETPQRTPLGTPQRTPRHVIQRTPIRMPTRTSYLESPVRIISRRPTSEFSPKSFRMNTEQSIDSDRIMAIHEDVRDVSQESPHFYDAKDDITINQPKMTLSEYLQYVGITFPNDLPVREGVSDYGFQYDETDNQNNELEMLPVLPELYLYEQACDQLIASIRKSDDIIDKIDREVSATNPQLFTEFMDGTVDSQMKIRQQLKDIKEYSLLRSEQEWFTLWTNKLKEFPNILKELQIKLNRYQELQKFQTQKLEKIKKYRDELDIDLINCRKKEQEYNSTDHEQLSALKQEIEHQGYLYDELKNTAEDLNTHDQQLMDEDNALDEELRHLNKTLKETEQAIEKNSCISSKDLIYAKNDYETYSKLFRWKLKRNDDQILHVEIGQGIDIIIDLIKLADHTSDAVTWQIASGIVDDLGPIIELLYGFNVIAHNRWDSKEILQDIACYWNSVEIIKRQIDRAERRSWAKLTSLEQDPFDPKLAGFSCDICLFSFKERLRAEIRFEIKVKDVLNLPVIDFSTLSVKIRYGNVEHDTMKDLIIQELTENGIIGLDQSLENVLVKAAEPQEET